MTDHEHANHGAHDDGATPHVGWRKYALIGVILSVVTGMEVAAVETAFISPGWVLPLLLILTAGKFFLVVLYYMHLKMDHAIFSRVFYGPLFLAVLVVIGMVLLFHTLPTYGKFSN
jgi:cytochrome c oxidase subunit IV